MSEKINKVPVILSEMPSKNLQSRDKANPNRYIFVDQSVEIDLGDEANNYNLKQLIARKKGELLWVKEGKLENVGLFKRLSYCKHRTGRQKEVQKLVTKTIQALNTWLPRDGITVQQMVAVQTLFMNENVHLNRLSHKKLREFAKRGLIVGPKESEEAFLRRCESAQSLFSQKLFSLKPDWISVEYSNKGLLPWQGAVVTTDGITQSVQLRTTLGRKKRYLGLYECEEILSHEMVHAVRMAFDEPLFEEILAYRTATTKLRTFLGPLFRSSKESILFLLSLSLLLLPWGWLPFLSLLFFFLLRLAKYQRIFTLTLKQLTKLLGESSKAQAFALHLIDKEIIRFSSMSPEKIISYALKKEPDSLRWRQICAFYFSD